MWSLSCEPTWTWKTSLNWKGLGKVEEGEEELEVRDHDEIDVEIEALEAELFAGKREWDRKVEEQRRIELEAQLRKAEEDRRAEAERQRTQEQNQMKYRQMNRCQHCGGTFTGLFNKKCSVCGKPKDYK